MSRIQEDGTYEQAVNLGSTINTKGNEITPFYDANERKLYFSSDWHYGFGGYDIFETRGEYVNWTPPKNLLRPVNSLQNDLYYSLAFDNSKAYITSNRKGSYFITAETCCNDIYAYNTGKKIEKRDTLTTMPDTFALETKTEQPKDLIDETKKGVKQRVEVTLYFHNDEPNPRSLSDTTTLSYQTCYDSYSALLNEYRTEFAKGLTDTAKVAAEKEVTDFFVNKVQEGYKNLQAFCAQLLRLLEEGNTVTITIKGYCSPLNYNAYNIHLGNRRVASLRNFFFNYRMGIFLDYIAEKKLILENKSFGEETASKTISDKRDDTRNSVYSPVAALERRVEIISVEVK
jgi:outer membrane protein OmpA-like peptidoglycan-associated protein